MLVLSISLSLCQYLLYDYLIVLALVLGKVTDCVPCSANDTWSLATPSPSAVGFDEFHSCIGASSTVLHGKSIISSSCRASGTALSLSTHRSSASRTAHGTSHSCPAEDATYVFASFSSPSASAVMGPAFFARDLRGPFRRKRLVQAAC